MPVGWHGHKAQLVPLDHDKHLENALRWLNDPQVTQWLAHGDFPLTRLAEREFFDKVSRPNETDIIFAAELIETEEHVGLAGIHEINFRHGVGTLGLLIGRPKLWGQGLGTDMVAALTNYAFEVVGLRLLLAHIFAENTPSLRVFDKCGYKEVSRIPQRYWKRGAYRDYITVAQLTAHRHQK